MELLTVSTKNELTILQKHLETLKKHHYANYQKCTCETEKQVIWQTMHDIEERITGITLLLKN